MYTIRFKLQFSGTYYWEVIECRDCCPFVCAGFNGLLATIALLRISYVYPSSSNIASTIVSFGLVSSTEYLRIEQNVKFSKIHLYMPRVRSHLCAEVITDTSMLHSTEFTYRSYLLTTFDTKYSTQ